MKQKYLTRRNMDVVNELRWGKTHAEVGEALFISEKTVKFHLGIIYKRLGLKHRGELLAKLIELELKPDERVVCSYKGETPVLRKMKAEVYGLGPTQGALRD